MLTGTIRSVRPAAPASFTFATLEPAIPFVTPLEVLTGDELTITFQVTNVGGQRGNQEVILLLNEAEVDSKRVTLERGSGQRVTFILAAPNKPGDYTVRVEELTRLFKVVLPVIPLRINSLLVITPRVQPGGTVFLNVEVENEGDVESTRTFTLTLGRRPFGGVEIETRAVTLPPRQTRTETFTFVAPEVLGTYQVGLEGLLATFEVVRAATLNLVQLIVEPQEVEPDELVTITVDIANVGDLTGETVVVLKVNGIIVERKMVSVPGLGKETVVFEVARTVVGDYTVAVEAVAAVDVRVLEGIFRVGLVLVQGTLNVEPPTVESGELVNVSIDVRNDGTVALSRTLTFFVDGNLIEKREVTVQPGVTETVTFTHVETKEGAHTVQIEGITGTFTVKEKGGFPIVLAIVVPIVVLLASGAGVFLYIRKKRGLPPFGPT